MSENQDITNPAWLDRLLPDEYQRALDSMGCYGHGEIHDIAFDVLDAAIQEYLEPPMRGVLENLHAERPSPGSVRYILHNRDIGPLGSVRLRKLDDRLSELTFDMPPEPIKRPPSIEDQIEAAQQPDQQAYRAFIRAAEKRYKAEQAAHFKWRCALRNVVIIGFLNRWDEERNALSTLVKPAEHAQPESPAPTGDKVIETYYRRHARNPKITLKQVCAEMGADYGYIRKRKSMYDKLKRAHKKR
ncbi:MAG: hypothetical protein M3R24_25175 [Chloroflexota bacterium]|nr:hypothetical protein [Chloroflexota bacterium]